MPTQSFEKKVDEYREVLSYKFWTFTEATSFCTGSTKFHSFYSLHPIVASMFGRDRFGLSPAQENLQNNKKQNLTKKNMRGCEYLDKTILAAIDDDFRYQITAFSLKMIGISFPAPLKKTMYFFDPYELIALVVTEGFILPSELQKAAGIYQMSAQNRPLSKPEKRQIRRQGVAQAFWHKYPHFSINEISRRFAILKKIHGFGFIHDSANRNKEIIRKLKPVDSKFDLTLPDIFKEQNSNPAFDFQKLKLVLLDVAYLLIRSDNELTAQGLLEHPLIASYIHLGGEKVKMIVEYSLRQAFECIIMSDEMVKK